MVTLEQQLSRLDLNLLVSLSVLIKERNVTRAAQALYLSQPAMSRTLGRLRELFDDPLFYRESNGLVPTQKALELQEPLEELLRNMQSLIARSAFTPESCDQTFAISLPPLMSGFVSIPLITALKEHAPKASLIEFPVAKEPTQQLADRSVDFSFHVDKPDNESEFPSQCIATTYPVFYVSRNHPLAKQQQVTLEECLNYRFVDMSLDIRSSSGLVNPIDKYLSKHGRKRDVVFQSGQLHSLVSVMQQTDTVMVSSNKLLTSSYLKQQLVPVLTMEAFPELCLNIYLIEHKRTSNSAPHQWLKALILSTLAGEQ
jgi:DNA-binding transcriptional LysR family regulator